MPILLAVGIFVVGDAKVLDALSKSRAHAVVIAQIFVLDVRVDDSRNPPAGSIVD